MSDWRESISEEYRDKPIVANARDLKPCDGAVSGL